MLMSRLTSQAFRRKVAVPAVAAILVILSGVVSNLLAEFLQDHLGVLGDIVAWRWSPVAVGVIVIVLFVMLSSSTPAPPRPVPTAPQTTADRQALSRIRAFFRVYGEPAYESEKHLLDLISTFLIRAGDAQRSVGILIQHHVSDAAHNSFAALRNALSQPASSQDLQQVQHLLGDWYEKYQWMTTWIHQGASHLQYSLPSQDSYKTWRVRDQKLLTALEDMMTEPEFEVLRERVLGVGWGESFRERLEETSL
jgi:hypothetical protein